MSGYIHAIAYFCWRDNLIRYAGPQVIAKDLEHQHSHDKLIRTEISALIGLMVRKPIDLSLPKPEITQAFIVRTETLLRELHDAMIRPWREGWEVSAGKRTEVDWFANAAALREPIFYGGESAYNFQYREFARLKYREDDNWLDANKGFRIDEACQIGEALGNLHSKRVIECDRSFRKQVPHERTMLPAFQFSAEDVAAASQVAPEKVERFLNTFSCGPDESNIQFTSVNEINVTNSSPIIKTKGGLYILLQSFSLLEAIYESPFYWLAQDPAYSSIASINRGRFTESFVADRLDIVFGNARVLRNINIYKGKNRFAEIDALVVYGDRAIVVQAKSKRLTIESRKGNDYQLKDDFKRAVQGRIRPNFALRRSAHLQRLQIRDPIRSRN